MQTAEAKQNKKDRKGKQKKREHRREKRMNRNAVKAFASINPDTGLATANPGVDQDSECLTPDQSDTQTLSPDGSTANNVHNDAGLFRRGQPVDTAVSLEISADSVGVFGPCPDPDGAGGQTAANTGTHCYLTGYQETGMAGDEEYHARINNDATPGESVVTFCADPVNNGYGDERGKDRIEILWQS